MTASVTQVLAHRIARGDGGGSDGNGSGSGEHTGGRQHERAAAAAAADPPYIPGLTQAAFALDDRRDGTAGAAGADEEVRSRCNRRCRRASQEALRDHQTFIWPAARAHAVKSKRPKKL